MPGFSSSDTDDENIADIEQESVNFLASGKQPFENATPDEVFEI